VCVAGEEAGQTTSGVGRFAVAFTDGLDLLPANDIAARAELTTP
jgi:hypothetical protein